MLERTREWDTKCCTKVCCCSRLVVVASSLNVRHAHIGEVLYRLPHRSQALLHRLGRLQHFGHATVVLRKGRFGTDDCRAGQQQRCQRVAGHKRERKHPPGWQLHTSSHMPAEAVWGATEARIAVLLHRGEHVGPHVVDKITQSCGQAS